MVLISINTLEEDQADYDNITGKFDALFEGRNLTAHLTIVSATTTEHPFTSVAASFLDIGAMLQVSEWQPMEYASPSMTDKDCTYWGIPKLKRACCHYLGV